MTTDPFADRLADYLGDEMTAAERRDFEQELARRPDLQREAEELQDTLATLRERSAPAVRPQLAAPRRERRAAWWSYAAAAVVAFAAGFFARGIWPAPAALPGAEPVATRGQAAIVEAYLDAPAESRFARILMALAHHNRPADQSTLD